MYKIKVNNMLICAFYVFFRVGCFFLPCVKWFKLKTPYSVAFIVVENPVVSVNLCLVVKLRAEEIIYCG